MTGPEKAGRGGTHLTGGALAWGRRSNTCSNTDAGRRMQTEAGSFRWMMGS